jgi:hypothetical protein
VCVCVYVCVCACVRVCVCVCTCVIIESKLAQCDDSFTHAALNAFVPIGAAISGTQLYLLLTVSDFASISDRFTSHVPPGVRLSEAQSDCADATASDASDCAADTAATSLLLALNEHTLESLCSLGVSGEICIGGSGLAAGYTRELLTKSAFVEMPVAQPFTYPGDCS